MCSKASYSPWTSEDEVLGTLGKVRMALEVDDLGVDRLGGRELLREKLEILEALVVAAR